MFHVKHRLPHSVIELGLDLTADQSERLAAFEELLRRHAVPTGMVARSDVDRLWPRHIVDSLRGAGPIGEARVALDLGSGAGLPGIPLAIARPDVEWVLLEPRRHRVAFLELVRDELGLSNVVVRPAKAAALAPVEHDVVVARAFGDPATTWRTAERLLAAGGRLLMWLGANASGEVGDEGPRVRLVTSPVAEMGPIAIMTRQ
jgi:16S rRNA (guanine527-N7)-methyltransferase